MKKIITVMCAMALMVSASAQNIIRSGAFGNVYVGLEGGATSSLNFNNNYWDTVLPAAGLEIGKDITPVVGFSIEGITGFNRNRELALVRRTDVNANVKFNLSNLFGGYKGQPRVFEVLLVPGVGWGHYYDKERIDVNFPSFNTFAQFNFNVGKQRAWGFNIKPGVVWNAYDNRAILNTDNADLRVTAGVFYRFNNKKTGSHNFVINGYDGYKSDAEAALAEVARLKNREPEVREVVKTEVQEKVVEKQVFAVRPGDTYITFAIGSTKLTAVEYAKVLNWIRQIDKNTKVEVVGSADSATGSANRNQYLAEARAHEVANVLYANGFATENVTTRTQFDYDESSEASRSAVIRVVIL